MAENQYILGVRVDGKSKTVLLKSVRERLTITSRIIITTPNPEIVLTAIKDSDLRKIINGCDYAVADGVGLIVAGNLLKTTKVKGRLKRAIIFIYKGIVIGFKTISGLSNFDTPLIKGRQLFLDLTKMADEKKWRVYILGGTKGSASLVKEKFKKEFTSAKFVSNSGPVLDMKADPIDLRSQKINDKVILEIRKFKPHLLFVAFGCPKQEKWIAKHLPNLPVGLAMGLGGSYNYVTGRMKVPPRLMANSGLEWMWRLIQEPFRIRRIINATVVFPYKVFRQAISEG